MNLIRFIILLPEESAETEPAWKGAGQKEGLKIWRIVVSFGYKLVLFWLSLIKQSGFANIQRLY